MIIAAVEFVFARDEWSVDVFEFTVPVKTTVREIESTEYVLIVSLGGVCLWGGGCLREGCGLWGGCSVSRIGVIDEWSLDGVGGVSW